MHASDNVGDQRKLTHASDRRTDKINTNATKQVNLVGKPLVLMSGAWENRLKGKYPILASKLWAATKISPVLIGFSVEHGTGLAMTLMPTKNY